MSVTNYAIQVFGFATMFFYSYLSFFHGSMKLLYATKPSVQSVTWKWIIRFISVLFILFGNVVNVSMYNV